MSVRKDSWSWLCVVAVTCVTGCVLFSSSCHGQTTLKAAIGDAPYQRVSNDIYMNPCKARAFSGDIALSDEEVQQFEHSKQRRDQAIRARRTRRDIQAISKQRRDVWSAFTTRQGTFFDQCLRRSENSGPSQECQVNAKSLLYMNGKLRALKTKLNTLEEQALAMNLEPSAPNEVKDTAHHRRRRAATAKRERLWEHGVVPFVIAGNFTGRTKALFKMAMRHWENHTCITFREKEPHDTNYITFTVEGCGCCSYVGKKGRGPQAISIGKHCDKFGIVVHELGHVIGFWHEHTRPDRDEHVQILRSNVKAGQEYNFDKMTHSQINSLGEPYDYDSIMHYSRNTFAKNNFLDTILPSRKPGMAVLPEIGQRIELSSSDIRQANKLYKCPTCGRTLQDSSARFSHQPTLRKAEVCQWRISATHGQKIILNITMLDIPKSYDCKTDFLEVRDGHYVRSPLIGRFCGDQLPPTMASSGTRLWLQMRSRIGQGKGFVASYEAICGGDINKNEGFLSSPNFPEEYEPNKNCAWKISVEEGFTVALKFQSFGIEKHDSCVYDYLEIRDGPEGSSPLINNYCGPKIPQDVQSSSRHLFIRFVSDGNVQLEGFSANFMKEIDECKGDEHGCDQICENTLGSYRCSCRMGYELHTDGKRCQDACGGLLDQEYGNISSPSYPDFYPANKKCIWEIVAPKDHKIHINFTQFEVEGSNQDCEFDSVRVSSVMEENTKLHGVLCGSTIPGPLTSESNKLKIEFNSDSSIQKAGFTAIYQFDKNECTVDNGGCQHVCENTVGSYYCTCHDGYNLHDDKHGCKEAGCNYEIKKTSGKVYSPNYPEDYPSREDCSWHFTTVSGHRIRLTFRKFELEPHVRCTYDHVAIHDGSDKSAKQLGKFCGSSKLKPVTSSSNEMFMSFFSDVSVERKGFEIAHDTVCGGPLSATRQAQAFVSHPHYGDDNYDNRELCEWRIQAASGRRVRLEFHEFDVEDETNCGYDYVKVFDGQQTNTKPVGVYCSNKAPPVITSSSQSLIVQFGSDDTIVMKGFMATYQLV